MTFLLPNHWSEVVKLRKSKKVTIGANLALGTDDRQAMGLPRDQIPDPKLIGLHK